MDDQNTPLADVVDDLSSRAGSGRLTAGELLDLLQDRSLGFILTLLALLVSLPPIGGLPGAPAVIALLILLAVAHALIGDADRFQAPERLRNRKIDADRLQSLLRRIRPMVLWIDGFIGRRMQGLVSGRGARIAIALTAAALACAMAVLALIPGLVLVASLGILMLGLALMGRDGLLALAGYGFAAGSVAALVYLWKWAV